MADRIATHLDVAVVEFKKRRDGMVHAMDGGLWLHRHVWLGRPMAHLVSTDRERLLAYGRLHRLPEERLQYKPLKDPRTAMRRDAWHWDLAGSYLPGSLRPTPPAAPPLPRERRDAPRPR